MSTSHRCGSDTCGHVSFQVEPEPGNAAGELVFVRLANGHVHKGVVLGEQLMLDERCNVDDAKGERTILLSLVDVEPDALCERCFAADRAALR